MATSPDMLATLCWVFNFYKNYCLYSSIFMGFFTCRSSLSSVLKWCSAWLTLFWVACLSSRAVLNRIWCSKSTVLFHWILILPLLKGLASTGREGEDSQWPKTKEMYEVVSVVFYVITICRVVGVSLQWRSGMDNLWS